MRMPTNKAFRKMTMLLLEETFVGSDKGGNVYLDTGTGWAPTLARLSAEQASRTLRPNGTTAAGHVFHTIFYLKLLLKEVRGEAVGKVDWADSWVMHAVDEDSWAALKAELQAGYEELANRLDAAATWAEAETEAAMAVIAHSAYHLGAVRQFLTVV